MPVTQDYQEQERNATQTLLFMSRMQTTTGTKVNYLSLEDEDLMVDFAFKALKKENEWNNPKQEDVASVGVGISNVEARHSADAVLLDDFDADVDVAATGKATKGLTDFTPAVITNTTAQELFRLYHEDDAGNINAIHTVFCQDILE